MHKLSVYILTYNEEAKIGAAIRSVEWADEVVVVDSDSTDATVPIAELERIVMGSNRQGSLVAVGSF